MIDLLRSACAFIIVLAVVITVHEFGHYLAARWRGVHVEIFSLGFGRAIASWRDKRGTQWTVAWIPLGGYVRNGPSFAEQSIRSRAIVVAAGPVANFVLAIAVFSIMFLALGAPAKQPIIGDVVPDSPASRAGLQPQDQILAIDDVSIQTFEQMAGIISREPDKRVLLTILRDGKRRDQFATLGARSTTVGVLGVTRALQPTSPVEAIMAGVITTWEMTKAMVTGFAHFDSANIGGPVRIAQISGQAAQLGLTNLFYLIATLSINLGLINLVPIPVLDGGRLIYLLIEALLGRPLPQGAQAAGFLAGGVVIFGLIVFATWNDVARLLFG